MRGTFEEPPTGLIPWFSKTEGNTYATIAAPPFPLQAKPTQAQDISDVNKALSPDLHAFLVVVIGSGGALNQLLLVTS